jgi:hypothetical protein
MPVRESSKLGASRERMREEVESKREDEDRDAN